MVTKKDKWIRMLTAQELSELRRDMLEASAWMRAELRCRRAMMGQGAVESKHPNPSPEGASNGTLGAFDS